VQSGHLLSALLAGSISLPHEVTATEGISQPSFSTAYVSIKQGGAVTVFPDLTTWAGAPAMLYTILSPDGMMLLVTSPMFDLAGTVKQPMSRFRAGCSHRPC